MFSYLNQIKYVSLSIYLLKIQYIENLTKTDKFFIIIENKKYKVSKLYKITFKIKFINRFYWNEWFFDLYNECIYF